MGQFFAVKEEVKNIILFGRRAMTLMKESERAPTLLDNAAHNECQCHMHKIWGIGQKIIIKYHL